MKYCYTSAKNNVATIYMLRILSVLALVMMSVGCERVSPEEKWVSALSTRIAADYADLFHHSQLLVESANRFCEAKRQSGDGTVALSAELSTVQIEWRRTMGAWQHIQWVRFGPMVENNDDWKIQFWPDKKNIVSRKVQQILDREIKIDQQVVADASVVVQGLSALELLLFDAEYVALFDQNAEPSDRQCQLIVAIGQQLVSTIERVKSQWQDQNYRNSWVATVNQEQESLAPSALTDVVAAMLTQMEKLKADKLGGPLGYKNRSKQPNGYFSEGWRSNSSLDNIKTNLLALQILISNQDSYDLRRLLDAKDSDAVANDIESSINEILNVIATIDKPLNEAVTDVGSRVQLEELHLAVGNLNSQLKTRLSPALGITLGFNSNDGD